MSDPERFVRVVSRLKSALRQHRATIHHDRLPGRKPAFHQESLSNHR
jgi:hypothetical protein